MVHETVSLAAQELPAGKAAPSVIHLMPLGHFKGRDGRSFALDDPEGLIKRFRLREIDHAIDYEHQADDPGRKQTGPVPAAGWITDLEMRRDGIWAHVKWTKTAAKLIVNREYRFISPTFWSTATSGKVVRLKGASLVHEPNLYLKSLSREEPSMSEYANLSEMATALGLPSDANYDAILSAIKSVATPDPAKYVPIEAVRDLMNDRGSKVSMARENEIEAMVSDALDSGHITPGMRDWAIALCRQDPDSFADFTKCAGPAYAHLFKPAVAQATSSAPKSRVYDEAELAICAQLDIEPGTLVER